MNILKSEKKLAVIAALVEGNSIRSTERMTGVHRDTICRLLAAAGQHCAQLLNSRLVNLRPRFIQCDEIWTFVLKKEKHVAVEESFEVGDQWVFVAFDADSKLVLSYLVGRRTPASTYSFVQDLRARLDEHYRYQITTDGLNMYVRPIDDCFGTSVDYAQLVKLYSTGSQEDERRYSPSRFVEAISKTVLGDPLEAFISTSYVERQNLTMRMCMRRFTRLTNAFSKKLTNLKAACALHFAHYNFCRVHSTLRVTPAMAADIATDVWPLARLLQIS